MSARMAGSCPTRKSGGMPPRLTPRLMAPLTGWKRMPMSRAARMVSSSLRASREESEYASRGDSLGHHSLNSTSQHFGWCQNVRIWALCRSRSQSYHSERHTVPEVIASSWYRNSPRMRTSQKGSERFADPIDSLPSAPSQCGKNHHNFFQETYTKFKS